MKKTFVIFFVTFSILIFSQENNSALQANFVEAMNTENNIFVIINVKNLNTNEIKEVCVTNADLRNATKIEKSITYNDSFELLQKCRSRDFEFKNKESLHFFNTNYSKNDLLKFEQEIDIDNFVKEINKNWNLDYEKTQEKTYLYGYSLSKKGLLMGFAQECFGLIGLWCVSCQEK